MRVLKALKAFTLNTLFPPVCVSCKTEGDFLCENCVQDFTRRRISVDTSNYEDPDTQALDGVIYGLDYAKNPQIQAAIKQFKYKFTQELADYFADLIVEKIGELGMVKNRKLVLIPVPLHKKRLNYRGFNQAELIARVVGDRLGAQAEVKPLLTRTKHTNQQARLSKKERHENLSEAFEISEGVFQDLAHVRGPNSDNWGARKKGERKKYIKKETERKKNPIYFLVDDVFTTGATLESAARTLKSAGLNKVYGLVVARSFDEKRPTQ